MSSCVGFDQPPKFLTKCILPGSATDCCNSALRPVLLRLQGAEVPQVHQDSVDIQVKAMLQLRMISQTICVQVYLYLLSPSLSTRNA